MPQQPKPAQPGTQVHIVHGEFAAADYDEHWVVGVFASKDEAAGRVDKLNRLLAKLTAKPNDQYASHKETWAPLDPQSYERYVDHHYVSQDTLSWNITTHTIE